MLQYELITDYDTDTDTDNDTNTDWGRVIMGEVSVQKSFPTAVVFVALRHFLT